jgi:chemosensory pili system protein ChpC
MKGTMEQVRSLWVPLRDASMLLPNAAVAEVGYYRVPDEQSDMPEWILGSINWRGQALPVISMELLCDYPVPANLVYSRLMIINSVRPDSALQFYAIVTAGLPRPVLFSNNLIDEVEACALQALQCRVFIGREQAVIPNLDYIQGLVEQHWKQAA